MTHTSASGAYHARQAKARRTRYASELTNQRAVEQKLCMKKPVHNRKTSDSKK